MLSFMVPTRHMLRECTEHISCVHEHAQKHKRTHTPTQTHTPTHTYTHTHTWTVFATDEGTGAKDASCTVRLTQACATSLMVVMVAAPSASDLVRASLIEIERMRRGEFGIHIKHWDQLEYAFCLRIDCPHCMKTVFLDSSLLSLPTPPLALTSLLARARAPFPVHNNLSLLPA